jgi:hypothetical protein
VRTRTARCDEHQRQRCAEPLMNLDGSSSSRVAVKKTICDASRAAPCLLQLESSCASHVRTRTTPPKHCSLSVTTAPDLRSAVLPAPARSSAIRTRSRRHPTLTSLFAARTAVAPRTTSLALRDPHLDFLHKTCPPQGTALGIVHQSDYYSVMRKARLHFDRLR